MGVPSSRPWRAFLVVAVGVFESILDLFIVNIAFPALQRQFVGASLAELAWVLNAYAIVFAALLVPAGKLGDLYGRRRLFMIGLGLFLAGSALSAGAGSLEFLIGARVMQAAGGAAMTPNSLGVILPVFAPRERAAVIGAWAAIGGVGAATGPVLGGLLTQVSWRWIFLVNLPLGVVALVLLPRVVAEIREEDHQAFPDVVGAVLVVLSIGLLALAISEGPAWSWDGRALGSVAASGALLVAFVRRSARHPAPIVELPMLAVPSFALAGAATVCFFVGFSVLLLGNILFLTDAWRLSVFEAGLALAPGPVVAAGFAGLSGRLAPRFGQGRIGAFGALLFALAALWFLARVGSTPAYFAEYLPGQLMGGAGIGLTLPALTAIAISALPASRLATGIGAQTMFRQLGAALGVALWVATVGGAATLRAPGHFHPGWGLIVLAASTSAVLILIADPRRHPVLAPVRRTAVLPEGEEA